MKGFTYLLAISIFLSCSCNKNDDEDSSTNSAGEIEYLSPIWNKSYIESQNWLDAPPSIFGNWSFDDRILTNYRNSDNSITLQCLDATNGSVCWEWSDWFNSTSEQTDGRFTIVKDNILHWKSGTRQYWLDIRNGTTLKRFEGDQVYDYRMYDFFGSYINLGTVNDSFPELRIKGVFKGDFFDEYPELILLPKVDLSQTLNDRASDITSAIPYNDGNDTMLIVSWQQVFPDWEFQSYLGLYNLSKQEWIYEKEPLCEVNRKGVLYQPLKKYKNTVITNVGKNLISYNYLTGEKVWDREFGHDFSFSGFEISENILVANCEDKNLYGINPNTGQILWTGEGAGTSSLLHDRIMDGVVYFKGGSSGYFHAVDIHTGETLWKLDPYLYEDNNAYWSGGDVHVIKPQSSEKGYVIINNALNTYCFEAAK